MKLKKFWAVGGAGSAPLRSATGTVHNQMNLVYIGWDVRFYVNTCCPRALFTFLPAFIPAGEKGAKAGERVCILVRRWLYLLTVAITVNDS